MTVKELKEILDGCNDNATVSIQRGSDTYLVRDEQIYHMLASNAVIIYIDSPDGGGE